MRESVGRVVGVERTAPGATLDVCVGGRPASEVGAPSLREDALADLPAGVRESVAKATHPVRSERYRDALAMHSDVERAIYQLGGRQRNSR